MITLQERVHSSPQPTGWSLNKLHRVFRVRKGFKNNGMQEDNLLSLSYGRIIRKSIDAAEGLLPESFETYQIVEPGNIVMRLTDLQNDKRSLRQGLVKERGIITSAYDALELEKGHDPRFWAFTLLALDLAKYYYSLGGGVRQSIKFSDFPNDWVSTPSAHDQKAIADFLDRETTRIDQLIQKKQRQIALLEEHFNAEIHKVISAGLDDTTPSKASGIQWFREIPLHWQLKPLRHVLLLQRGHDLPSDDRRDGHIPIVTSGGVSSKHDVAVADAPGIVTGRYGTVGKFYYIDEPYWPLNTTLYSKRIFEEPRYVWYLLQDMSHIFILNSSKSAVPGIDRNDLHSEYVPVPPKEEQKSAIIFLEGKRVRKERLSALIFESVEKLQEVRSSLITAAVTGQIDVATWGKQGQTDRHLDHIQEAMGA